MVYCISFEPNMKVKPVCIYVSHLPGYCEPATALTATGLAALTEASLTGGGPGLAGLCTFA